MFINFDKCRNALLINNKKNKNKHRHFPPPATPHHLPSSPIPAATAAAIPRPYVVMKNKSKSLPPPPPKKNTKKINVHWLWKFIVWIPFVIIFMIHFTSPSPPPQSQQSMAATVATTTTSSSSSSLPIIKQGKVPIEFIKLPLCGDKSEFNSKSGYVNEDRCRVIFEELFNCPFPSVRPSFLLSPVTNRCLELDGYCPNILTPLGNGVAFEHHGKQHYKQSVYFKQSAQQFTDQVKRDIFKLRQCTNAGILLITIPYNVSKGNLYKYIVNKIIQSDLLPYIIYRIREPYATTLIPKKYQL